MKWTITEGVMTAAADMLTHAPHYMCPLILGSCAGKYKVDSTLIDDKQATYQGFLNQFYQGKIILFQTFYATAHWG